MALASVDDHGGCSVLQVTRRGVCAGSRTKSLRASDTSVAPAVPPSVRRTGRLCGAALASAGSGAIAPAAFACPRGTTESARPERPARGRAVRTSYPTAAAGKCCWLLCTPSLRFSAWQHCNV